MFKRLQANEFNIKYLDFSSSTFHDGQSQIILFE